MPNLATLLPNVDVLLAYEPAELAPFVLEAIRQEMEQRGGQFHEGNGILYGLFPGSGGSSGNQYPAAKATEVAQAVAEAVGWLKVNQILITAPGNGSTGNFVLSRRAKALNLKSFSDFVAASSFPRALLHPLLADQVWLNLLRGDFGTAVFIAFRTVEEAVREAGGYQPLDVGVDLVRKAFHEANGPLTKMTDPMPERQALSHLFAGAMGSYKNPHSHRTVALTDAHEAQEMVMLASHLLRIVDARR